MDKIAILGIGKLGLCFALNLERAGYEVFGVDLEEEYVLQINEKQLKSYEPQVEAYLQASVNFSATTDMDLINDPDISLIFIAVATPSTADGGYDHSQIDRVLEKIKSYGKCEFQKHIAIVCTTMPGYCDAAASTIAPLNYSLSYNPEFIAQGSIISDQQKPDQVLIGEGSSVAGDLIENVYRKMCINEPVFCRMSRLSAEITKLATNCFLTTKISFANSIGDLAVRSGAEPEKILAAIGSDSRIGGQYLKYGFGFGGPCFPRDNKALKKFADDQKMPLHISAATDRVNSEHLSFQFERYLKNNSPEKTIVFDYVSYKKGTVLLDESQQLALAVMLAKAGRKVLIKDRKVVLDQVEKMYPGLFILENEPKYS